MKLFMMTRSLLCAAFFFFNLSGVSISGSAAASPPMQATDPAFQVYLPYIADLRDRPNDTFEWNDGMMYAYGPIKTSNSYTSYLSMDDDQDWFFFDIKTLGMVTVELTNIVSGTADIDIRLYNSAGLPAAISQNDRANELIEFLPAEIGRYYIHIYRWGGENEPTKPYHLKVTYNTQLGIGEIFGYVIANKEGMENVSVCLNLYDTNAKTTRRFQTMSAQWGKYQFRGVPSLQPGQYYESYFFNWYLGPRYAGYVVSDREEVFVANSTFSADFGGIYITPIDLIAPPHSTIKPFPVTFSWIPRYKVTDYYGNDDAYQMYISGIDGNDHFWMSGRIAYMDSIKMTSIPIRLKTGIPYVWGVIVWDFYGGYAASYYERLITFDDSLKPSVFLNETSSFIRNHMLKGEAEFEKSQQNEGDFR